MRAIEIGFSDPVDYTWMSKSKQATEQLGPRKIFLRSFDALTNMRGIGLKWGEKVRLPPMLGSDTTGYLKKSARNIILYQIAMLVSAIILVESARPPFNGSAFAYLNYYLGLPESYRWLADICQALSLGITACVSYLEIVLVDPRNVAIKKQTSCIFTAG